MKFILLSVKANINFIDMFKFVIAINGIRERKGFHFHVASGMF